MAKTFALLGVVATRPCRIRLYSTAAQMVADAPRAFTTPVTAGSMHGLIADLLLNASTLTWIMSPDALGSNMEATPSSSISYNIENLDVVTGTVGVTFTFNAMEA
jgi:hypothetical protein